MPYESEKLKSRVFYYLCMVLAGCILANIVLRCDRDLQVFILPFTDSSRLAGVSVQQTLFYVLLQRTKQVAVVYLLYKVFPPKAVFSIGMSALLFLFGFVISCQMFYLGLSGVWFLLLCLFPHYLIYLGMLYYLAAWVGYFVPWGYFIPLNTYRIADWDQASKVVTYMIVPFQWPLLVATVVLAGILFFAAWYAMRNKEV